MPSLTFGCWHRPSPSNHPSPSTKSTSASQPGGATPSESLWRRLVGVRSAAWDVYPSFLLVMLSMVIDIGDGDIFKS